MKVILVGEYSGFHNNLKDGLLALGHEVLLAGSGDGFKELPTDIIWESKYKGISGKVGRLFKILTSLPKLKSADVLQIINPTVFSLDYKYNDIFFKYLFEKNKNIFYVSAGDDPIVWDFWKYPESNNLKYSWIPDVIKYDLNGDQSPWEQKRLIDWQTFLVRNVDGIIPIMFEYARAYEGYENSLPSIPIPINTDKITYKDNVLGQKLVIFHGLNRYGAKGTVYIEKAFEILKRKYPNDLELIIDGKMPYKKYLEVVDKANVVIDQVSSYSLAVNALTSMAKGKVVLGGAEPEGIRELNYENCPAINILPDPLQIVSQIEMLLERRHELQQMGFKSREFVEKNHNYIKVASLYVETWSKKNKIY